jgi:hypothetical protein
VAICPFVSPYAVSAITVEVVSRVVMALADTARARLLVFVGKIYLDTVPLDYQFRH